MNRVELLGSVIVRNSAGVEVALPQKPMAVLVTLALNLTVGVDEEVLIDGLWPSTSKERARKSLQMAVTRIRKDTDGPVTRNGTAYSLPASGWTTDLADFENGRVRAGRPQLSTDLREQELRNIVRLIRGPELTGLGDAAFFEADTHRIDGRIRDVITDLADTQLANHHPGDALALLESHAARFDDDERFCRLTMLALYALGRSSEAVRTYFKFRDRLVDTNGLSPSPELEDLVQRMLNNDASLGADVPTLGRDQGPMRYTGWMGTPHEAFVGRRDARRQVDDFLRGDTSRLLLVTGEAGLGKTRLVAESVTADPQLSALFGRCEAVASMPYEPFFQACWFVVQSAGINVEHELHNGLTGVPIDCRVGFSALFGGPSEPGPTGAGLSNEPAMRTRLFNSIERLLELGLPRDPRVSNIRLVVIDDLHNADQDTVALLRHLVSSPGQSRLRFIATIRDGLAADPITGAFEQLLRAGTAVRLSLEPMGDASAAEVLRSRLTDPEDPRVSAAVASCSGNPLYLGQMASVLNADRMAAPHLPPDAALGDFLRALNPDSQRLLETAAAYGYAFSPTIAAAAAAVEWDRATGALQELVKSRLVDPGDGSHSMTFRHPVVHNFVLDQMDALRRSGLHHNIAVELERSRERGNAVPTGMLAFHHRAGVPVSSARDALTHTLVSATEARENWARHREVDELTAALDLAVAVDPTSADGLRIRLAEAQAAIGRLEEGKENIRRVLAAPGSSTTDALLPRAALIWGGSLPAGDFNDPEAVELIDRALGVSPDDGLTAQLLARKAQLTYWDGTVDERRALCADARRLAEQTGDPLVIGAVAIHTYWALEGSATVSEQWELANTAQECATTSHHRSMALHAAKCRLHSLTAVGDMHTLRREVDVLAAVVANWEDPEPRRTVDQAIATMALAAGDFETGEALMVEVANRLTEQGRHLHGQVVLTMHRLPVRWLQGRLDELAPDIRIVAQMEVAPPVFNAIHAWIEATLGDHDAARQALNLCIRKGGLSDTRMDRWLTWCAAALTCVQLDTASISRRWLARIKDHSHEACRVGQTAFLGFPQYYEGLLLRLRGDREAAVIAQVAAHERAARQGSTPWAHLAALEIAEMTGEAPAVYDGVEELAKSIRGAGLEPWTERADAL